MVLEAVVNAAYALTPAIGVGYVVLNGIGYAHVKKVLSKKSDEEVRDYLSENAPKSRKLLCKVFPAAGKSAKVELETRVGNSLNRL